MKILKHYPIFDRPNVHAPNDTPHISTCEFHVLLALERRRKRWLQEPVTGWQARVMVALRREGASEHLEHEEFIEI